MSLTHNQGVFVLEKDSGEVRFYESRHAFQRHAEPIDIENCEYRIWDSNGIEMQASVDNSEAEWLRLECFEVRPKDTLDDIIARYAQERGIDFVHCKDLSFLERITVIGSVDD